MKKIVLFLAMALLLSSLTAQTVEELKTLNQTVSKNGIISQQSPGDVKSTKKTDEETWVKDSTYYYTANGDEWQLDEKSVVEQRDEYGNPVVEKTYFYDAEKDLWEPVDSIHMKWHAFEVQAEEVTYAWNSSEQIWSDTIRHEEYNENGKLLKRTGRAWDYDRDSYVAFSYGQSKYTYDSNNLLIEETIFSDTRTGEFWKKYLYQYDENGNIMERLQLYLDNGDWINSWRYTYTYNENGLRNQVKSFVWDTDSVWFLLNENNYEYDGNGNNSMIESIRFSFIDSAYIKNSKIESLYDSNNNHTKNTTWAWDGTTWVSSSEFNYFYNDENGLLDSMSYRRMNSYTQNFENIDHEEYFWSPSTNENISIKEPQENIISVSPNPVSSLLQINTTEALISTIDIYSTQGQLIKRVNPENSSTIDCSRFNSGIYFMKFKTSKSIVTKKILKQ